MRFLQPGEKETTVRTVDSSRKILYLTVKIKSELGDKVKLSFCSLEGLLNIPRKSESQPC